MGINADPADGWLPSNDFSQWEYKTEGGSPHHQDEDHHHHDHQSRVTDEKKDNHIELKSDLTETGSKSDLLQPSDSTSRQGEQHIFREEFDSLQQSQVEQVVRSVLDANFKEVSKFSYVFQVANLRYVVNCLSGFCQFTVIYISPLMPAQ